VRWFHFLFYYFKRAFENLFEAPLLHFLTIGIIAVTLFLLSGYMLFVSELTHVFDRWGKGIRVIAYLDGNQSGAQLENLKTEIKNHAFVEGVVFVSQDEALTRFRGMLKGNEHVLEDLSRRNPLPPSFEIDLKKSYREIKAMETFSQWLKSNRGIDDVVYGQEWVERFATSLQFLRVVGTFLFVVLVLASIFIISNTIKISLYARKEELQIMLLVGATPLFIKIPFVLEGALQGLLGACLALLALFSLYHFAVARLGRVFAVPDISFFSVPLVTSLVLGGMVLGALGSVVSVGQFLRK